MGMAVALAIPTSAQSILHVDDDAAPGGDGLTWLTAYRFLRDALAHAASPGSTVTEIHVAQGTYKADQGEAGGVTPGDREATFQLITGIALLGGYAGIGAPDPAVRDHVLYETILSGDLLGDDIPAYPFNNSENSYHVVTILGTDDPAVDGLTVRAGNADGSLFPHESGGGVFLGSSSATLSNCNIAGNFAINRGAGIYTAGGGLSLTDCVIRENRIDVWGPGPVPFGGGIFSEGSIATLENCTFVENVALRGMPHVGASGGGGGLYNKNGSLSMINCTFSGNWAATGGGLHNQESDAIVFDCRFTGNFGGGMFNDDSSPMVINCSFSGNETSSGFGGGMSNLGSSPIVADCTFAANRGPGMYNGGANPTVIGCTFVGNVTGSGCKAGFCPGGAGMENSHSSPTVVNCIFIGNRSDLGAGGMLNQYASDCTVVNCIFIGNVAAYYGSAMFNVFSSPTLTNCTLVENVGLFAAVVSAGDEYAGFSNPTVSNCVVRGSGSDQILDIILFGEKLFAETTVRYSDVEGGFPGVGNIDANPMFIREPDGGGDGYGDDPWTPDVDEGSNDDYGDLRLSSGSPCIDAGHNWGVAEDLADLDGDGDSSELTPLGLDGNPRFADDPATADTGCGVPVVVDMGPYEYQGEPAEIVYADLTGDGIVGMDDFDTLMNCWSSSDEPCCVADLDLDGTVGVVDFLLLLAHWG
jgi:hypothetical protein